MGPRNDFVCLSKKCQQDGEATVYFDLPKDTKFCPECGSKRIRKILSANFSREVARETVRRVDPYQEKADEVRRGARRAEEAQEKMRQRIAADGTPIPDFSRPIRDITGTGQDQYGMGQPGQARPAQVMPSELAVMGDRRRFGRPTVIDNRATVPVE